MATYFRSDGWVKSALGQAVSGAQVYVCSQPADVTFVPPLPQVPLFADAAGATPLAQPIFTDGFGHYDFYVPYGTYTVVIVNGGNIQQIYPDQTVGFSSSGGGAVSSVFGRTGVVAAQAGDYAAFFDPLGAAAAAVVGLAPLNNPSFTGTIQIVNTVITGTLKDGGGAVGTPGQLLSSTGTGTAWVASYPSVNSQTSNYQATLADANNIVTMTVVSSNSFTVPASATVPFSIGATLTVIQLGTGQTTLVAAGGVSIHTPSSLTARVQYSTVSVIKVGTDTWVAAGDLT